MPVLDDVVVCDNQKRPGEEILGHTGSFWRSACRFIPILALLLGLPILAEEAKPSAFDRGMELERRMRILEARDQFKQAIAADPQNAGYLEHAGWFLLDVGFVQEAADMFERFLAVNKSTDKSDIFFGLGFCERRLGRLDRALAAYGNIYELPKNSPSAAALRVINEQLDAKDRDKLRILEEKTSQGSSGSLDLRKELFQALVDGRHFEKAWKLGSLLRKENSADIRFQYQYARSFFWGGNLGQAESEYQALIELSSDNAFFCFELGRIQNALGKLKEAEKSLKQSVQLDPAFALALQELSEVLAMQGRGAEAIKIADSIKDERTQTIAAYLARARARHFSGAMSAAIPYYRALLARFPENEEALDGISDSYVQSGDFSKADDTLQAWQGFAGDKRYQDRLTLYNSRTRPVIRVGSDYYWNSIRYTRFDEGVDFRFKPSPTSWLDAGYAYSHFSQPGFNGISRNMIYAESGYSFSREVEVSGRMSGNLYDNNWQSPNGGASTRLRPCDKVEVNLGYNHVDIVDTQLPFANAILNPVATIGSLGNKMYTDDYSMLLVVNPTDRLTIFGKAGYGEFSDGNRKLEHVTEANYKIFRNPLLVVAANHYYLDFQKPASTFSGTQGAGTAAYYDPINFEVWSARAEFSQDLSKSFRYGIESSVHYMPKSDGVGESVFVYLNYKWGGANSLRFDARYFHQNRGVGRSGPSGDFSAINFVLVYEHRF